MKALGADQKKFRTVIRRIQNRTENAYQAAFNTLSPREAQLKPLSPSLGRSNIGKSASNLSKPVCSPRNLRTLSPSQSESQLPSVFSPKPTMTAKMFLDRAQSTKRLFKELELGWRPEGQNPLAKMDNDRRKGIEKRFEKERKMERIRDEAINKKKKTFAQEILDDQAEQKKQRAEMIANMKDKKDTYDITIENPYIADDDIKYQFENVYEDFLHDINRRREAIQKGLVTHKKIKKNPITQDENQDYLIQEEEFKQLKQLDEEKEYLLQMKNVKITEDQPRLKKFDNICIDEEEQVVDPTMSSFYTDGNSTIEHQI